MSESKRLNPKSESDRQNDPRLFSNHFLVTIYSCVHQGVVARVPEEVSIQLSSEWDTPLLQGGSGGFLEVGFQELLGKSTKTQFASAQVWSGSSPIDITLPLEFYADQNPKTEVIDPIVRLAKMALPRKSGKGNNQGLFTPPGPRIFGLKNGSSGNDQISIDIGNFLNFKKVIITAVNPTFVTRDLTKNGLPLKATCEVTFRSMFSLTGDEFAGMFKDIK